MAAPIIPAYPTPAPTLPARTLEVLRHAAAGRTVAETADAMHYSSAYVHELRAQLFERLGVENVAAAVAAGFRLGLLR